MANNKPGDSNFSRCLIFIFGAYSEKTQSWITPVLLAIITLLLPHEYFDGKILRFLNFKFASYEQREPCFSACKQAIIECCFAANIAERISISKTWQNKA